jgi:sec-independent protein translocase protein TatA
MFGLSFQELFIVAVVAILLFGKNLPEMAKKFGGMYRDFRKSLDDLRSQVDFTDTFNSAPTRQRPARKSYSEYDDIDEISAPRFEPPPPPPEQKELPPDASGQSEAA